MGSNVADLLRPSGASDSIATKAHCAATNLQTLEENAGAGERLPAPAKGSGGGGFRLALILNFGLRLTLDLRSRACVDLDLARLHRVRNLTHQIDGEQTILQVRVLDTHEIGQLEAALERARRDSHVQEVAVAIPVFRFAARDHEKVLPRRDVDLIRLEAGDSHRNPIAVVTDLFDVEWGVIVALVGACGNDKERVSVGLIVKRNTNPFWVTMKIPS